MTEKNRSNSETENKFEKEQPLRHPLAVVAQDDDKLKINKQLYRIIVNKDNALDVEMLRKKYDPYLDQYDYIVGDVSSEHLRLKGFYKNVVRTAIERKQRAIADYLIEYCNPGAAYFVLELISPTHKYNYSRSQEKRPGRYYKYRYSNRHRTRLKNNFKKRCVHQTRFPKKKTIAVQKGKGRTHAFVIKKRKD